MKLYKFKTLPQDFIVEEKIPPQYLDKGGGVLFIFWEKKNVSTFEIVYKLMQKFQLVRKDIGIAGLKDKIGITRQRLSIYKRKLQKIGGQEVFIEFLSQYVRILQVKSGNAILKIGANSSNLFFLRLRKQSKKLDLIKAEEIDHLLHDLLQNGFPNYFGNQRFSQNEGKNYLLGKDLILDKITASHFKRGTQNNLEEAKFKVQSFSSYLFNEYLKERYKSQLMDCHVLGDILMNENKEYLTYSGQQDISSQWQISGPCYGFDLFSSQDKIHNNPSFQLEKKILHNNGLSRSDLARFEKYGVFGIRRPIKQYLLDLRTKFEKNGDLLLMIELKPGTYASVFVEYFDYLLDKQIKSIKN